MTEHRSRHTGLKRMLPLGLAALLVLSGAVVIGAFTADEDAQGARHHSSPHHHAKRPSATPQPSSTARPSTTAKPSSTAKPSATAKPSSTSGSSSLAFPPANAGFDYQLGGSYTVPKGVKIVSRDRTDAPASGVYSICYINAFQTQPGQTSWWKSQHPDLLLQGPDGPVVDSAWDEILLDVNTAAKRQSLMTIIGPWIDGCATKGFKAVEPDNLDSWTRSDSLLTRAGATAFARLLVQRAHAAGLAVAQKNALGLGTAARTDIGFDFAIAEDCANYEMSEGVPECQGYQNIYGNRVLVVEYDDEHFDLACRRFGSSLSIARRDRDLTTPGSGDYAFDMC